MSISDPGDVSDHEAIQDDHDNLGNRALRAVINYLHTAPSAYTGKITSSEDGTTFARATGAKTLTVTNLETTATSEFAVFAFGTSASDAQTNLGKSGTTPNIISETGVGVFGGNATTGTHGQSITRNWPRWATHAAIGNGVANTTQVCMVEQGI